MPVIYRVEKDLFRFSDVCNHMVCPVPTEYNASGLVDAFVKKDPKVKEVYKELCDTNALTIGKPVVRRASSQYLWDTIFFPMKTYADDTAKYKDVRRNIEHLRTWLSEPLHVNTVVGIPMLGCEGGGDDPYKRVMDMLLLYLDPLPATTFLSMSPAKALVKPEYLVIVGPKGIAKTAEEKSRIDRGIKAALNKWGMKVEDFTAVVTGSETTFDRYITGTPAPNANTKGCWALENGARQIIPLTINWEEDKSLALTRHRLTLTEIGTHFILIMPENVNNNRAIYINAYVREANQKLAELNRPEKKVMVIGKKTTDLKDESPLNIE